MSGIFPFTTAGKNRCHVERRQLVLGAFDGLWSGGSEYRRKISGIEKRSSQNAQNRTWEIYRDRLGALEDSRLHTRHRADLFEQCSAEQHAPRPVFWRRRRDNLSPVSYCLLCSVSGACSLRTIRRHPAGSRGTGPGHGWGR